MKYKIPFAKPYITRAEKRAVNKVLSSGQLGQGKKVEEFEEMFAKYVGSKYAVAVSSGTSALFLSLRALGIGEGDNVIVPSLTFTASASVIHHCGATPIFCDVDMKNLCMDEGEFTELSKLTRPKAAIIVHLTGNSVDWKPREIPVIFDSAHLIEENCHQGDLQTYSFHPTKNMTTGFGGMITTNNEEYYKYLKLARLHGCTKRNSNEGLDTGSRRWGYDVSFCGWKMNMNDIQAAIGIEQLKKLNWMNEQRLRCIIRYNYNLRLKNTGLHLYPMLVRDRVKFMDFMDDSGIQCSVHFEPLHLMKAYSDVSLVHKLPNTEWIGRHIVSLPLFPELKNKQIDYICQRIKKSGFSNFP